MVTRALLVFLYAVQLSSGSGLLGQDGHDQESHGLILGKNGHGIHKVLLGQDGHDTKV